MENFEIIINNKHHKLVLDPSTSNNCNICSLKDMCNNIEISIGLCNLPNLNNKINKNPHKNYFMQVE